MKQQLAQKKDGFTIIEVVLVLAVAALIMLMVLVAVPAMQRNQRDDQRQRSVSELKLEIGEYTSRNNGSLPAATNDAWNAFFAEYMRQGGAEFADPRGDEYSASVSNTVPATLPAYDEDESVLYIYTGATCNGEDVQAGAGQRRAALVLPLEGGGRVCQET